MPNFVKLIYLQQIINPHINSKLFAYVKTLKH